MTQQTTSESRGIDKKVIALAVICIILAASLVGIIALYQPNDSQSQLAAKDATINSLNAQIASLNQQLANAANSPDTSSLTAQINNLNQRISSLNASLTSANSDLAGYQQIVNLQLSGTLYNGNFTQEANATTTVWTDQLLYAGFIVVEAQATANTTYAKCRYTVGNYNFDYNVTLGTVGSAMFPVIGTPAQPVAVGILMGNINQTNTNSVNATITYHY